MSRRIPQFEIWEKPAESKLFSDSLSRVLDNYAHFCVAFVSYLHGRKEHSWHRTRSSEVTAYVEAVKKECDEAVRDAQAAAAWNNATAHDETHRANKEIKELIRKLSMMPDFNTANDQEAHKWQTAVSDLHVRLESVQNRIAAETTSKEQQTREIKQLRAQLVGFTRTTNSCRSA